MRLWTQIFMQGTGEKMNLNQKLQSIAYEKILKMPGTKYKFANMVHAEIRLKLTNHSVFLGRLG